MTLPMTTAVDADTAPSAEAQTQRLQDVLHALCARLGAGAQESQHIVASGCLRLEGVDFALHLNAATQHLEFFGDCGVPAPYEEAELHRHLLEQALSNEIPSLCFARHPVSGHIVAKGSLFLAAIDDEAWLGAALVLTALTRIKELQERFTLAPNGHP